MFIQKQKIMKIIRLAQKTIKQIPAEMSKVALMALALVILPIQGTQASMPKVTVTMDKNQPLPFAIASPQDKISLVIGESNLAKAEREAKEASKKAQYVKTYRAPVGPIDLGDLEALYRQAEAEFGIPAPVIRAVASVESGEGHNMSRSSAGAMGFGQFMPGTWRAYGNGGDPYNPADAIPAMARLLAANGGAGNIERALYAYNHAGWYVTKVLNLARQFGYGG